MRRAIIVIGGFTENPYHPTGSFALQQMLFDSFTRHEDHGNMIIVFTTKNWKHDWKGFASYLNINHFEKCYVAAYSWGAGYGLKEFAKYFTGKINATLCDPVYYSKYFWMRWKAIRRRFNKIKYTSNVTVDNVFYQEMDEPGNDIVAGFEGKRTRLCVPHRQMDDHPAYHKVVKRQISLWLKDTNG